MEALSEAFNTSTILWRAVMVWTEGMKVGVGVDVGLLVSLACPIKPCVCVGSSSQSSKNHTSSAPQVSPGRENLSLVQHGNPAP